MNRGIQKIFERNREGKHNRKKRKQKTMKEGFKNDAEREEYEAYLRAISLLSINAYESKEIPCKIEIIDMEEDADFYLEYYDDKFKLHKIAINIIVRKKK